MRRRAILLNDIRIHMSFHPLPLLTRMTQNMADLKLLAMLVGKFLHVLLQQNIAFTFIRIQNPHLCLIILTAQNLRDERIARRNPRTTKNERDLGEMVLSVFNDELPFPDKNSPRLDPEPQPPSQSAYNPKYCSSHHLAVSGAGNTS